MFSRIKKIIKEHRELEWLAYHDSLTGLLNRNWLYKFKDTIDTSNLPYVYFIDLNGLGLLNKRYGHIYGDGWICCVVQTLLGRIGGDDILIRYAGDEFVLFSSDNNVLYSCDDYCVGAATMSIAGYKDIMSAIKSADHSQIIQKENWKLRKKEAQV
jgi:GGDEF domain-containing protein